MRRAKLGPFAMGALAVAVGFPAWAAAQPCPMPPPMPNYRGDKPAVEPHGTETFKAVKPGGGAPEDTRVTGEVCRVTYRVAPGKDPATEEEIQSHYRDLYGKLGASLPFTDARTTVAHLTAGGPEIWTSVSDAGGVVTIVVVRPAGSAQAGETPPPPNETAAKPRTAADLKSELDRAGRATLHLGFAPGKALLAPADDRIVGELLTLLTQNPNLILDIEAYADQGGNPDADRRLSKDRADALVQALTLRGVPGDRVPSTGLGSADAGNTSDVSVDPNRIDLVKR